MTRLAGSRLAPCIRNRLRRCTTQQASTARRRVWGNSMRNMILVGQSQRAHVRSVYHENCHADVTIVCSTQPDGYHPPISDAASHHFAFPCLRGMRIQETCSKECGHCGDGFDRPTNVSQRSHQSTWAAPNGTRRLVHTDAQKGNVHWLLWWQTGYRTNSQAWYEKPRKWRSKVRIFCRQA